MLKKKVNYKPQSYKLLPTFKKTKLWFQKIVLNLGFSHVNLQKKIEYPVGFIQMAVKTNPKL